MALYEDLSTGRCRSDKFEVNSKFVWTDADYTIGTEAANKINVYLTFPHFINYR